MYTSKYPIISVTVDVVLLAVREGASSVLLIRRAHPPYAGDWALPGGFLDQDEDAEAAARRELQEETGIAYAGPLPQLRTYSAPDRDPRGRTVSIVHLASLGHPVDPVAGDDAAEARWFAVDALPELAFDHAEVLADAMRGRP